MSFPSGSEDPPSYDDLLGQDSYVFAPPREKSQMPASRPGGGEGLVDTLTTVRATHVRSVVDTHVFPLIEDRASRGLAKTTIALIPANVVTETAAPGAGSFDESLQPEIVGLADSDDDLIGQVRLQGAINRFEFWKQPEVVTELRIVLEDRLASSSRLADWQPELPRPAKRQAVDRDPTPTQKSKSFWGRSSKAAPQQQQQSQVAEPEQGGSIMDVKVALEEICLRTVSVFGLFETMTRPVIVIRIDARC